MGKKYDIIIFFIRILICKFIHILFIAFLLSLHSVEIPIFPKRGEDCLNRWRRPMLKLQWTQKWPIMSPQHISYGNGSWIWFPSILLTHFFKKANQALRNFHFSCFMYWNISSRCFSSTDSAVSEIIGPCTCRNNFAPTKGDSLQKYHQK